jgi:hypothetical protein
MHACSVEQERVGAIFFRCGAVLLAVAPIFPLLRVLFSLCRRVFPTVPLFFYVWLGYIICPAANKQKGKNNTQRNGTI